MKLFLLFWILCGASCASTAETPCGQPPGVVGICRMALRKFTYDKTGNKCFEFIYGGCQGNQNQFETMDECTKACIKNKK
ncbi:kunitz-type serine protease inhibitor 2-like [Drosophila obscura]|uniref:kunitz-type serine protease inhibitor 2-like n=1 Tax=Drosophila obscura TaxID=7282 RepID=UPI000BA0F95E|nr:kunitz-type serine protease inhibitor 2-like [Drosophila obscura]